MLTQERPVSQIPKLPDIEHPLSRLQRCYSLISGIGSVHESEGQRPLPSEGSPRVKKKKCDRIIRSKSNSSRASSVSVSVMPEFVKTDEGAKNKTKLPLFGVKSEIESRCSTSTSKIYDENIVNDAYEKLREKVKSSYSEIRKRFIDNDPQHHGSVTREAFARILQTIISKVFTQNQVSLLLQKLKLRSDKQIISFSEFYAPLREECDDHLPKFMDPVQRQSEILRLNADQTHIFLKNTFRRNLSKISKCFPSLIEGGKSFITYEEFKKGLDIMNISIHESELLKLCHRYDPTRSGDIRGVEMLKQMQILMRHSQCNSERSSNSLKTPPCKRKLEIERDRSINVELFLKTKFRESFDELKQDFEREDPDKIGLVSIDSFIKVLSLHNLHIEKVHLKEFLARCVITATKDGIPYRDFLHRFQDRSESGITHRILNCNLPPEKPTDSCEESLTALEKQLINMFQRDFLTLLESFRQIDRYGTGLVQKEEFRAVLESKFRFDFTEEQFMRLMQNVALNKDGLVRYNDFLKQFDTNGITPSMFSLQKKEIDPNLIRLEDLEIIEENETVKTRSVEEIVEIIKKEFSTRFQDIVQVYEEVDELNSGKLDPDMMYFLFKKLGVDPEFSRAEIRKIWPIFIVSSKNHVDFKEFVRFFVHSPEKASFPNAKLFPPKRGDADFMKRSNKLNSVHNLLEGSLKSKIDLLFENLRREFIELDPNGSGFVSIPMFQDLLRELCVNLSDTEIEDLTKKFKQDEKVSYVEFLRPFLLRRQVYRHGSDMLSLLHHPAAIDGNSTFIPSSRIKCRSKKLKSDLPEGVMEKLQKCNWKTARKHLRKLDMAATGRISIIELKAILHLLDVQLSDEDCFMLQNTYDANLSGYIDYTKLLQDIKSTPLNKCVS